MGIRSSTYQPRAMLWIHNGGRTTATAWVFTVEGIRKRVQNASAHGLRRLRDLLLPSNNAPARVGQHLKIVGNQEGGGVAGREQIEGITCAHKPNENREARNETRGLLERSSAALRRRRAMQLSPSKQQARCRPSTELPRGSGQQTNSSNSQERSLTTHLRLPDGHAINNLNDVRLRRLSPCPRSGP